MMDSVRSSAMYFSGLMGSTASGLRPGMPAKFITKCAQIRGFSAQTCELSQSAGTIRSRVPETSRGTLEPRADVLSRISGLTALCCPTMLQTIVSESSTKKDFSLSVPHFSTKQRILDSAESLFARHGFAGASLRQVTATANVNLAAVNYHFGSKENLINEVFRRRLDALNEERLKALQTVLAQPKCV